MTEIFKKFITCMLVLPSAVLILSLLLLHLPGVEQLFTVYFYRGCALITLAALLTLGGGFLVLRRTESNLSFRAVLVSVFCSWCFIVNLFQLVPVSLDRSISVFLIGYMHEVDRPVTQDEMEKAFLQIYMQDYAAMPRRIHEQTVSGNFIRAEKTAIPAYELTSQGQNFVSVARLIAALFACDAKFLYPKRVLTEEEIRVLPTLEQITDLQLHQR